MTTPDLLTSKDVADCMYQYSGRVNRAIERCNLVEDSERIMGYTDSAAEYREIAREISDTRTWVSALLSEMISSGA